MSETKDEFTPGPWRVSGGRREVYAKDPNGFTGPFVVADCSGREQFGPLSTCHHEWVSTANARLIAAAPDMLEALREAVHGLGLPDSMASEACDIRDRIQAVIEKATGATR